MFKELERIVKKKPPRRMAKHCKKAMRNGYVQKNCIKRATKVTKKIELTI